MEVKAVLEGIIKDVEELEKEINQLKNKIADRYKFAKNRGFNVKALRKLIAMRKDDPEDRAKLESDINTYIGILNTDLLNYNDNEEEHVI